MAYIEEPKDVDLAVGPNKLSKKDIAMITKAAKAYGDTGVKATVVEKKIVLALK